MPEYKTPGVYIEEISAGPRPVQPSSTTDTGFIAVLTLPTSFIPGKGKAEGMFLPIAEANPLLSWNRALAFRNLLLAAPEEAAAAPAAAAPAAGPAGEGGKPAPAKPTTAVAPKDDNRLKQLISESLPGKWELQPPSPDNTITIKGESGDTIRFPVSRTLVSTTQKGEWDLSFGADELKVLELIKGFAIPNDIGHSGNLAAADDKKKPVTIDVDAIHAALAGSAPAVTSLTSFEEWRYEFAEKLFVQIVAQSAKTTEAKAKATWDSLAPEARASWNKWLRQHPGMHRLEIAVLGFFENGGATAYPTVVIQSAGTPGPNKRGVLEAAYDTVSAVAMLAAPGLKRDWQQAILDYAGPKGRGDLFAVMDTPRYFLTRNPADTPVDELRWTKDESPYEVEILQTQGDAQARELRFNNFSNEQLLDRVIPRDDVGHGAAYGPWFIVDNPLSTGPHDRYVVAPPSGHVCGVIAATDLKAGGGVHKAPANEPVSGVAQLVTQLSDKEQGFVNIKNINIVRHRPGAGIRVWGARTTGADPLWRYISVRRLFLFVERSVRDAVTWAVFLPNTDVTRRDLATTIRSFLYSLWNQGMLDGASHSDAYNVKCDRENNPDVDVRSGILTVDVTFRPPYPAEFVRIRFRQAPMEVPG